jgi:hypothetical protein
MGRYRHQFNGFVQAVFNQVVHFNNSHHDLLS